MSLAVEVNLEAVGSTIQDNLQLLQSLPAAIYTCDNAGRILFYNQAAVDLWGRAPVIGKDLWCGSWRIYNLDGTPMPLSECPMAIAIQERRPVMGREIIVERPDGLRRCVLPYPTPLLNSAGEITGAVNMLVDISERRRGDDARDRLAAIVESSEDAIISKNLDGVIQTWNASAERLLGYTADEAIGQSILMIIPPERVHEETTIQEKLRRGERVEHFETIRRRKDGSLVELSLTISPIRDSSGRITGGSKIARDITQRRQAERKLRESEARLKTELADTTLLQSISAEIIHQDNIEVLYEKIMDAAVQIMRSDFASMQMLYPQGPGGAGGGPQLLLLGQRGFNANAVKHWHWVRADSASTCGEVLRTGKRCVVADVEQCDCVKGEDLACYLDTGIHAVQSTPLISRSGELIGMISTHWRRVHEPSQRDLRLLDILARQAADLIERRHAEQDLVTALERERHARQEAQILVDTVKELSGELDLHNLVQKVTDAGTLLIGAQFGSFFHNVLDERGESYQLFALSGAPREAFEKFGQPRNTAVFEPTFRGEAPIRCDDIQKDPRYGKSPPHYGQPRGHLPVHSYLAAPVISRTGKVHGGLFFGHERVGVFTKQHERLIVGIAAQAAVAIDNAQLFQQAEREIAERTRAERDLVVARDAAEAANRAKDRFLAVLSHELRTPLSPVALAVSAMEADADLPFRLRGDLAMIRRNVDLEARLIDDLLDLSRVTNGKLELRLERVHLHEIINHVLQSSERDFAEKRLKVDCHLDASTDRVHGDPARLQQVVWNLVRNAVKFTPDDGRITIRAWNEAEKRSEGRVQSSEGSSLKSDLRPVNSLFLEIRDSGIGIDSEFLPRIFDAFEQEGQGDPQRAGHPGRAGQGGRSGGLGLGLAIARAIIERHGGTITATSDGPGRGARFIIGLDVLNQPSALARADDGGADEEEKTPVSARILLVEDHLDSAQMLARLLKSGGYAVTSAATVQQALELASKNAFDVLVSDIGLPDGTGYDLMRQLGGKLKGIALSGYGMEEDIRKSEAAGFTGHMVKPISATALQTAIERLIGRASA